MLAASALSTAVTDIYAWRHGETFANGLKVMAGGNNTEITHLNDRGQEQARAFAQRVLKLCPHMKVIYSSDLARTLQTAQEVQKAFAPGKQIEVRLAPQLRENLYGKFELFSIEERDKIAEKIRTSEIEAPFKDRFYFWRIEPLSEKRVNLDAPIRIVPPLSERCEEPETVYELYRRVEAEFVRVAKENPGDTIGISTHGGVLSSLIDAMLYENQNVYIPAYYHRTKFERKGITLMPAATKVENCGLVHFRYHHESEKLECSGIVINS